MGEVVGAIMDGVCLMGEVVAIILEELAAFIAVFIWVLFWVAIVVVCGVPGLIAAGVVHVLVLFSVCVSMAIGS